MPSVNTCSLLGESPDFFHPVVPLIVLTPVEEPSTPAADKWHLSERHVLSLHEKLSEIRTRFDLCVLYPFRALKTVGLHT
jgi:hypothetical protein